MIPTVGLIVAIYAIARLLQVPLESSESKRRGLWLFLISAPAILAIGFLAFALLQSGTSGLSSLGEGVSSTPSAAATQTAIEDDAAWQKRLLGHVTSAGQSCSGIHRTAHGGIDSGTGENIWTVWCTSGESYTVRFKSGESPRVELRR
jgi:hypothetical protein